MEAESKEAEIEQLQEKVKSLNTEITQMKALIPVDSDTSMIGYGQCKFHLPVMVR